MGALLSLLAPFPYSLDYRPYFTIHDPAFAPLAAGTPPTPASGLPLLLGITNMYFLKVPCCAILYCARCSRCEGLVVR